MIDLLIALLCLAGILKSADFLIDQSISLAKKFKISSFVIGFTIIAFGTSLPELIISLYSSAAGHTDIAVANVIGSNMANICLILGIITLYRPYELSKTDVFENIPLNLVVVILFTIVAVLNNGLLSSIGGTILLIVFLGTIIFASKNNHKINVDSDVKFNPFIMLISLFGLVFLGKICVDYLLSFSANFGIEESLIGYFIVAIGTSLPELIASFTAVKKGNTEIGIGSIIGSNIFNLLFILGTSSFIRPINLQNFILEILILALVTMFIVIMAFVGKKYYFSRAEGSLLILSYILFVTFQILL